MSDDPRIPWLTLQRMPTLGARSMHALLEHFGDAAAILNAEEQALRAAGAAAPFCEALRQWRRDASGGEVTQRALRDLDWMERHQTHLIHWRDERYPERLRQIYAPPPVLHLRGDPQLLRAPQLALVGARRPTAGGKAAAGQFAAELARAGLTVSSGLARGIDSIGHRQALAAGGTTVAALGSGLERIYPPEHLELSQQIAEQGALISEFPLDAPPSRSAFPQRNRIISGMSLGVLVVEAALRSGSLITARYAREQGREVFAVPGSIYNPMSKGCNRLIRDGAKLVEEVADILEELPEPFCSLGRKPETADKGRKPQTNKSPDKTPEAASDRQDISELNQQLRLLLEAVGFEPTPADLAIARSRLAPGTVTAALNELELGGWVERTPMGYIRRR